MRPQNRFINQLHQHLFSIIYLFFRSTMDTVSQHGSSSGYNHDGPDFLIAQQHLQVVADLLAGSTFQAMDVDPRADATASLSAIRAILSPESHEVRAALAEEAQMQTKAKLPIGAVDGVGIGDTGDHNSVTAGDGMEAIGAADSAGIVPYGMEAVGAADVSAGAGAGLFCPERQ